MLKKVTLYGVLADKYGKDWSLDVNSPEEALAALAANNMGFRQFVTNSEQQGVGYYIKVGTNYLQNYEELSYPSGIQEIKIIPEIRGSRFEEGAGPVEGGTTIVKGGKGGSKNKGKFFSGLFSKLLSGLLSGGISKMLSNTPEKADDTETPTSYGFDGPLNTTKQGVAVPVCYGQLLVGGAIISSGIEAEEYTP